MAKKRKRKKHALQVEKFELGKPTYATPALTVIVPLQSQDMELNFEKPGDSQADRRALHFFRRLMQEHPRGVPGRAKNDFLRECQEHLRAHGERVPPRRLDQLWTRTIDYTGAVAFRRPGPR